MTLAGTQSLRNQNIREKCGLVQYAVRIIAVVEELPDSKVGKHIGGQLIRSGTSPAPNYGEAQAAESR